MITARLKSNPLQFNPQSLSPLPNELSALPPTFTSLSRIKSHSGLSSLHSRSGQFYLSIILLGLSSNNHQSPPPSLREILSAYRTKGDGDRDMLLAMLSAKTAEDQVGNYFFFFVGNFLKCLDLSASIFNGFAPSHDA